MSNYEGIAILGSHPATVGGAPMDGSWLIYSCSPHNFEHRKIPRIDAWFEIHKPVQDKTRGYSYLKYLETLTCPVWIRDTDAIQHFPTGKLYPESELRGMGTTSPNGLFQLTKLGKFSYYHFTSSIAFIMAKAIDDCERLGIPAIGLWGIMQASGVEYAYQRPGIQYFLDQAWRKNLRTDCPDVSHLFEPMAENF